MDHEYEKNEKFREHCYIGDLDLLKSFYRDKKPDVNSKNKVNGWTALHWASKKNNLDLVKYLLEIGADPCVLNNDQKPAGYYTKSSDIKSILLENEIDFVEPEPTEPVLIPNFVKNPQFHYVDSTLYSSGPTSSTTQETKSIKRAMSVEDVKMRTESDMITVRVRSNFDEDFIEFDFDRLDTEIAQFKDLCRRELDHLEGDLSIQKIRKLPNILIRNTNDVKRLKNEQEIEIVFSRL